MHYNTHKSLNIHPFVLLVLIVGSCSLFFIFDLALPLGVAGGVPYVATVLIGIWLPKWWHTVGLAILVSILTGLGFLFSEPGSVAWIVLTNRALALFAIWTTTILLLLNKKAEKQLIYLNRELEKLSFQDGLTELANRRMFDLALDREWGRSQRDQLPLSLIMLDIDFFKQYNDHYGHQQGDECLKQIAQALNGVSKRSMDLIARYGGEEFVVLLPNTNNKQAIQLAKQCCSVVVEKQLPHNLSTVSNVVTISVGVGTVIPSVGSEPSTLVNSTDKLLYQAKNNGRNQVEYQFKEID